PRSSNRTGGFPASGSRTRRHMDHSCDRLDHVGPRLWISTADREVTGSHHSPWPSPRRAPFLNSGPFPPPELLGFPGTTSLSATPGGPACPSRASGRDLAPLRWGFPCCSS